MTGAGSPSARPRLPPGAATIALLTFLAALGQFSTSVYLPSLPAIARDLAAPMPLVQLTLTAYLAGMALAQLFGGPLADRFGRRPVVLGGLAIYLAGSALATLAPTLSALMAGRILQAIGAAGCAVASRAVVRDSFEGAEIARAMGGLFAWSAGAPDTFIDRFGFSATQYGLLTIVTVAGFVGGGLAARRLVASLGEARLGRVGSALMTIGAAATIAAAGAGGGASTLLAALTVWTAGMGMILPNALGAALRGFPDRAGTASALLGFAQGASAALGAAATGALHDALGHLAFPAAMATFTALAVAGFLLPRAQR